jgi:uncharacterized repeat protein (TIGR01451 family)
VFTDKSIFISKQANTMRKHIVIAVIFSFWASFLLKAQTWEYTYGTLRTEQPYALVRAMDGGFLMAGFTTETTGKHDAYVIKADADGRTQWEKIIGKPNIYERIYGALANPDGSFMVVGTRYKDTSQIDGQAWIVKLSARGDTLWTKSFLPNFCTDVFYNIQRLRDGTGYILTGTACVQGSQEDILLVKTDLNGNLIWNKTYGASSDFDFGKALTETSDGGFVVGGSRGLFGLQNQKVQILKLDRNGNLLWQKFFGKSEPNFCYDLMPDTEGGCFALGVETDSVIGTSTFFKHYGNDGREIWSKNYPNLVWGVQFFPNRDGGFSIISGNEGGRRLREFVKTDALGNILMRKPIRIYNPTDELEDVIRTDDSAFVMLGRRTINNNQDFHLSRIDKNGDGSGYFITGKIFNDQNNNCLFNTSEKPLVNWLIKAESPTKTLYGFTDSLGVYKIYLDSSVYRISLVKPTNYWQACRDSIILSLSNIYPTHNQDFAVKSRITCPLLDIDVATPFLRRCFENTYVIRYCNRGTGAARNASVRLTLDKFLTYNSSNLPLSNRTGNVLFFNIGDIAEGVCGEFRINATVRCDSTFIGQSHCVEAHIFPDSICAPPVGWSGASIQVSGVCEQDSVSFIIKNVGTGTTSTPIKHIIIEDNIVFLKGNINNLLPNTSRTIKVPATGNTYRLISDQEPNHPNTSSQPTAVVEGCRVQPATPLSIGFVTQFPEDDGDPFTSIDCHQNIGAFDPNDKSAQPIGIGNQHFIDEKAEIDYTIRFQNTGTDTAFTVVVKDTLSPFLDISSFKSGVSSHKYQYEIIEGRILKFTFKSIKLPDSTRNAKASQGFFRYSIRLKNDVPFDARIENRAAIYFDFNAPIFTNQTFHTLRKPQRFSYTERDLCNGTRYNNQYFSQNIRLYDTLKMSKWDSININYLKISPTYKHIIDTTLKSNFLFNGVVFQRDTNIVFYYTTKKGCDSTITYKLKILTASKDIEKADINIYPNPLTDKTLLLIPPQYQGNFEVQLYDITGRLVSHQTTQDNVFILEKGNKSAGLYVFKILNNNKIIAIGKLMIVD